MLARALDAWWDELGRPDPFVVVEAGAGTGTLAAVDPRAPACRPALRYVAVERSAALRAVAATGWPAGPRSAAEHAGRARSTASSWPTSCSTTSRSACSSGATDGLGARCGSTRGPGRGARAGRRPTRRRGRPRWRPSAPVGGRIPLQHRAGGVGRGGALAALRRGRVVVVDYADTTAVDGRAGRGRSGSAPTGRHGRGGHPLDDLGTPGRHLRGGRRPARRAPTLDRSQAEFLRAHGLDDLVDEARRRVARSGPTSATSQALEARSRVTEAAALTDPSGLGAFRVLEWEVPG